MAKAQELMASENTRKAQHQSKYRHVNWNQAHRVWQVQVSVHGVDFSVARFPFADEWYAAQEADSARWHLQDFVVRRPHYNFPNELPRVGDPSKRIQQIRRTLLMAGVPRNKPHDERFVPFTLHFEPKPEPNKPSVVPFDPSLMLYCEECGFLKTACECASYAKASEPAKPTKLTGHADDCEIFIEAALGCSCGFAL